MGIPFGFKLQYHKSIEYSQELEKFLKQMLNMFSSETSYKRRRPSTAYFRRGVVGLLLDKHFRWGGELYTFKRLTSTGRRFGVLPVSELDIESTVLKQCKCAEHAGGVKVDLKKKYDEDDWTTFAVVGTWR